MTLKGDMLNTVYSRSKLGVCKSLHTLQDYDFEKDKYLVTAKGFVYVINADDKYVAMSPFITKDGYVEYVLTEKSGNKKHIQAQRIVAIIFISNPKNLPQVNHRNGNKEDNARNNLQWITASGNSKHSYDKLGKVPWNKK